MKLMLATTELMLATTELQLATTVLVQRTVSLQQTRGRGSIAVIELCSHFFSVNVIEPMKKRPDNNKLKMFIDLVVEEEII